MLQEDAVLLAVVAAHRLHVVAVAVISLHARMTVETETETETVTTIAETVVIVLEARMIGKIISATL